MCHLNLKRDFCAYSSNFTIMPALYLFQAATALTSAEFNLNNRLYVPSHGLQQQHNGVELLPGPVVGPQRHDEVVQPVPCALRRHNDRLVFEAVGAGILEKGVVASLEEKRKACHGGRVACEVNPWNKGSKLLKSSTLSMRRQQKGIFSWSRWHNVGELPMYGEFSGYPFTHLQHEPDINAISFNC